MYYCSDLHPGPKGVDDDDVAVDGDDGERQRAHVHREPLERAVEQGDVALSQLEVYRVAHLLWNYLLFKLTFCHQRLQNSVKFVLKS